MDARQNLKNETSTESSLYYDCASEVDFAKSLSNEEKTSYQIKLPDHQPNQVTTNLDDIQHFHHELKSLACTTQLILNDFDSAVKRKYNASENLKPKAQSYLDDSDKELCVHSSLSIPLEIPLQIVKCNFGQDTKTPYEEHSQPQYMGPAQDYTLKTDTMCQQMSLRDNFKGEENYEMNSKQTFSCQHFSPAITHTNMAFPIQRVSCNKFPVKDSGLCTYVEYASVAQDINNCCRTQVYQMPTSSSSHTCSYALLTADFNMLPPSQSYSCCTEARTVHLTTAAIDSEDYICPFANQSAEDYNQKTIDPCCCLRREQTAVNIEIECCGPVCGASSDTTLTGSGTCACVESVEKRDSSCNLPACLVQSGSSCCCCAEDDSVTPCCKIAYEETRLSSTIMEEEQTGKVQEAVKCYMALPQHKDMKLCIACRFNPSPLINADGQVFCPGNCGCCLCPWLPRASFSRQAVRRHEKLQVCKCRTRGTVFHLSPKNSICTQTQFFDVCPCRELAEAKHLELYNIEMWNSDQNMLQEFKGPIDLNDVVEIRPDIKQQKNAKMQ